MMNRLTTYAPAVLRIGLSLVMLWFGSQQLLHVGNWVGYLPEWTASLPLTPEQLVYANGLLEVVLGLFMLAGLYVRFAAFVLALHMLEIAFIVSGETRVRDLGLAVGLISIFCHGHDKLSVDTLWHR